MILDVSITEKCLEAIDVLSINPQSLEIFLSHRAAESDEGGIAEYTLWAKDKEATTHLQLIKFQHHSHDKARLIARQCKELLVEG